MRVLPIGCVTKGRAGKLLAELGELADAGCIGFSDDGSPVGDAGIMRRALEYAAAFDLPIIDHCEDPQLMRRRHARGLGLDPPRPQGHPVRLRREHGGARHLRWPA